ncbi:MAG: hypothetical protein KGI19_10825 [Thaumarchaeota archaeon]|nr:hypothetical protein [Nitrososphaerota archaeon]
MSTLERIREFLGRIIESYENLKKFELNGCTKDELRTELINLRNACEELPSLFVLTAKDLNFDIQKVTPLASLMKLDFLQGIKIMIMTLSEPYYASNKDELKRQANLAVTFMNLNGSVDTFRLLHGLLK